MMQGVKPYPAYKDSRVPWLGEIPDHWEVKPLKRWVKINRSVLPETTSDDYEFDYFDIGTVGTGFLTQRPQRLKFGSAPSRARRVIGADDTILSTVRTYLKAVYYVAAAETKLVASTGFAVLTPGASTEPRFVSYLALSEALTNRVTAESVGIAYPAITETALGNFPVGIPPLGEQVAIVHFLNYADQRIRRYIRGKQKLIALLKEQQQAVIHHAITGGLDPSVRLKRSGVRWLGDIPEHWRVAQVRSVARVVRGGSPRPAGSPLYFHGSDEPWITVGEITRDPGMYLVSTSTRLTNAGVKHSRTVESGTLLLTNSGATLGIPKITHIRGCINDGVAAFLNLRPDIYKEFFYFFWATQTTHLRAWVYLGAQPNLNTQIIGGWPIVLPTLREQENIVERIKREVAPVAEAMAKAAQEIGLIRDYRTRLIADVVTGKLDVREAAANLPNEVEEPEELSLVDEVSGDEGGAELASEGLAEEEAIV
jgi:type I restriction enzyme S subunit